MKSFRNIALAAMVAVLPTFASAQGAPTKDIVETAVAAGSFKTLATALTAAGLIETLKSKGPFTVFAPTDEAFAKLPAGTVVVRVDQPLGRLAFFLLEPRSDDGFLDWNFFDEPLQREPRSYPILRTFTAF